MPYRKSGLLAGNAIAIPEYRMWLVVDKLDKRRGVWLTEFGATVLGDGVKYERRVRGKLATDARGREVVSVKTTYGMLTSAVEAFCYQRGDDFESERSKWTPLSGTTLGGSTKGVLLRSSQTR